MALDLQHLYSVIAGVMSSSDNYNTKFNVTTLPGGGISYKFVEGDTVERAKQYIAMLREIGAIPANAGIMAEMGHENPTNAEFREAKLAVMDVKAGGPWLSVLI